MAKKIVAAMGMENADTLGMKGAIDFSSRQRGNAVGMGNEMRTGRAMNGTIATPTDDGFGRLMKGK